MSLNWNVRRRTGRVAQCHLCPWPLTQALPTLQHFIFEGAFRYSIASELPVSHRMLRVAPCRDATSLPRRVPERAGTNIHLISERCGRTSIGFDHYSLKAASR